MNWKPITNASFSRISASCLTKLYSITQHADRAIRGIFAA
jgi:hypothetical protein